MTFISFSKFYLFFILIFISNFQNSNCLKLFPSLKSPSKFVQVYTKNHFPFNKSLNAYSNKKRSVNDQCSGLKDFSEKLNSLQNVHVFQHDSNPVMVLSWSGKEGVILVLTTMNSIYAVQPSRLYRSTDRGKSFVNISKTIGNTFIQKTNGFQVNPEDTSNIILLTYQPQHKKTKTTKIFVTTNAGFSFTKSTIPFHLTNELIQFNPVANTRLLILSSDHTLYISTDSGLTWVVISSYIFSAAWDPLDANILYYTYDPEHSMSSTSMEKELYRYNVDSRKSLLLAQHVHHFKAEKNFLFLTVQFSGKNSSCVCHVSQDKGSTWNAAQLPMIKQKQFYSLLDMTEDMVFVHVDDPGNFGKGDIYTSGKEGVLYSLSLKRHLLPIRDGLSDFYKVKSLPGVYITSVLDTKDHSIDSRITFDKGASWQPIAEPVGSVCANSSQECHLHIHNTFSQSLGVHVPSFPLSSHNTVGLILAHGDVGDGLTVELPDVFISDDGGYKWTQPSQLTGPHYLAIGDSGGILYALPASHQLIKTIKFSLDEGQCWYNYEFADKPMLVSGIGTEPGEQSTDLSIYGWSPDGDMSWMVVTVDFKPVLGSMCSDSDYVTWQAHQSNMAAISSNGCLLGSKQSFKRRVKGSVCVNGKELAPSLLSEPCQCQKYDYLCDYGYKRKNNDDCVKDVTSSNLKKDICIDDKEELIKTQGYRLVPGDKCKGGFTPSRHLETVKKSCAQMKEKQNQYGVHESKSKSSSHGSVLIVTLLIATVIIVSVAGYLLYRKRKQTRTSQFSPLTGVDTDAHDYGSSFTDVKMLDVGEQSNSAFSYHDDSDQELIVT